MSSSLPSSSGLFRQCTQCISVFPCAQASHKQAGSLSKKFSGGEMLPIGAYMRVHSHWQVPTGREGRAHLSSLESAVSSPTGAWFLMAATLAAMRAAGPACMGMPAFETTSLCPLREAAGRADGLRADCAEGASIADCSNDCCLQHAMTNSIVLGEVTRH